MKMIDKSGRPRNLRFNWRDAIDEMREDLAMDSLEIYELEDPIAYYIDVDIISGEMNFGDRGPISWN